MEKTYQVYLARCRDGTLYCGYTVDIRRRLLMHNAGLGAKYTRSRQPVTLAYLEELPSKSAALRRENELKKLSRAQKEALIGGMSTPK